MISTFVDTSAWWAYFDKGDQWHTQAARTMKELIQTHIPLATTEDVFDEVVTGLLGRVGHQAATRAGRGILESPSVLFVIVDSELFREAWNTFQRYGRMGWSFTDCTSMTVMKKRGMHRAFSFDLDFRRMGFELIPSR